MAPLPSALVNPPIAQLPSAAIADVWPLALALAAALVWFALVVYLLVDRNRALRAAAFNQALAKAAPGSHILIDADGRCRLGGKAADWFGDGRTEIDRDTLIDTFKAGLLDHGARRSVEALLSGEPGGAAIVLDVRTADGSIIAVRRVEGFAAAASAAMDLLWLEDRTDIYGSAERSSLEAREAERMVQSLRAVFDAAPFPIWLRDSSLDLIAVNSAYVRAVEQSSEAAVLERQSEIVANALTGSSRDTARRARESGGIVAERHFAIVAGQRRALLVTDAAVDDKVAGFAVDVTEVEEARAEVAHLIDSHSETLNKLLSPVAIFDAERRLRFFNSAFARLSRLPEDWLGEHPDHSSLLEAMREKRRLPEQADFQAWKKEQLEKHKNPEPGEEMWHLPDGSTLRVVTQPHPLGGVLMLFEDVTDRLALESSYNTLIAVQRETLNNLHEAVAVFGSDGRLKLFNPAYAEIWKIETGFLEGEPHFGDILERARGLMDAGGDWDALKDRLLGQLAGRSQQSGRWHRPDGRVLDYALVPLPDGRLLTTHVDITDSFRIEHALRERNEALETADRLKSEFVANMSYELRTPLNSIIGFAELLEKGFAGEMNDKQRAYVHYVTSAAGQLRDLIDNILDLAVIEAGAMTLDIDRVPIADLVNNAVSISREQARKAGLKVEVSANSRKCGEIEGDQRRLTQALYNLITNAIRFTPPGGKVTIRARRHDEDTIELVVADTGIGISEKDRDSVFEKFHTGPSPTARSGVGLGLSLVKSFIELHSGSVELSSSPNKGTTVRCVLPRRQSEAPRLKRAI